MFFRKKHANSGWNHAILEKNHANSPKNHAISPDNHANTNSIKRILYLFCEILTAKEGVFA